MRRVKPSSAKRKQKRQWRTIAILLITIAAVALLSLVVWPGSSPEQQSFNVYDCGPGKKPIISTSVVFPQKGTGSGSANFRVIPSPDLLTLEEFWKRVEYDFVSVFKGSIQERQKSASLIVQTFPKGSAIYQYYAIRLWYSLDETASPVRREFLKRKETLGTDRSLCWAQDQFFSSLLERVPVEELVGLVDGESIFSVLTEADRQNFHEAAGYSTRPPRLWDPSAQPVPDCLVLRWINRAGQDGLLVHPIPTVLKITGCN